MTKSITTSSPIPQEILDYARCAFIHTMVHIIDEKGRIRTICKECNEKKLQK